MVGHVLIRMGCRAQNIQFDNWNNYIHIVVASDYFEYSYCHKGNISNTLGIYGVEILNGI